MSDKALTTTNGTSVAQFGEMSVQTIVDRKRKLVEVMEAVMVEGVHYGRIPGCGDKPTLYKAGAEILATVFGLAPTFQVFEQNYSSGHREYRVTCTLTHIASGKSLGEGVGTCSSMESKYRWRAGGRVCPECSKPTIIRGKADYGGGWLCFAKKGGCGAKWKTGDKAIEDQSDARAENPDIADQFNTVLKMSKKRAQVDAILTATGASDILTQDLEDLPPGSMRDVPDAEYRDMPPEQGASLPPSEDAIAMIDSAPNIPALEALVPMLGKLKGEPYKTARKRYGERREALKQMNGAA